MLESKLQAKCVKLAKKNKVLARKIHAENNKGFPDLLLIFPITGKTVYVEMKSPTGKGKLSKVQEREIERIRAQNASVFVCDSYSKFAYIITLNIAGLIQGV